MNNKTFAYGNPEDALSALAEGLSIVQQTRISNDPLGMVLAEPVLADRPSPAADVSAMDGYAIRMADLQSETAIKVGGESQAGAAPPEMLPGQAVRIFTGAMVPNGCDAVIKREDTIETDQEIRLLPDAVADTRAGANIRREGENAPSGNEVLPVGTLIDAASTATLANFGWVRCRVYRPVRVAVLTTGDEVVDPMQCQLRPWQLRNSNRNAVCAVLRSNPFAEVALVKHLRDDPPSMLQTFRVAIEKCDAVVITGGVSMGDYDFVPDAVQSIGGRVVFHGLPIRPGKPILGATHPNGKLILGLPGNPVSATINARRFLVPCLRRMAGVSRWDDRLPLVTLSSDPRRLPLHTMLLAKLSTHGNAELVASKGSGDLVALGHSDGFVCVDADSDSPGPWPFVSW